jgi:hypothetical protein
MREFAGSYGKVRVYNRPYLGIRWKIPSERRDSTMRRIMSSMLGLYLLMGSVALFAEDAGKDTTKKIHQMETKTKKNPKKGAKSKSKKKTTDQSK